MASPAAAPCGKHRRRSSVAACTACGLRVCTDCLVHTPVGIKCRSCTTAPTARARRRQSHGREADAKAAAARRRRMGMVAGVLGLLIAGGVAIALRGGGEPEETPAVATGGEGPRESIVSFAGADDLRLRGTLRVPDDASDPVPGAVIIPGFGPTNRDGIAPPAGAADPLYRDLSQTLAEAGIASLRYDKRGTGESPLGADEELEFADMVDDAAAALTFLGERVEVDRDTLALVGHDEGGLTALRVAGAGSESPVAAVVLISTPGRPLVEVLADDIVATSEQTEQAEETVEQLRTTVDELVATGDLPDPDDLRPALRPVFPPDDGAYLRAIFGLDPGEQAGKVDVPALIVRGDRDPGVSAEDADRLAGALGGDTDVLVGAESGHTLAIADASEQEPGAANVTGDDDHDRAVHSTGASDVTRDDALLEKIGAWLRARLRPDHPAR